MTYTPNPENLYLSVAQVADRLGVSVDTIWRWSRNGNFPKPVKIGPNVTRWRQSDVLDHEATFCVGLVSHQCDESLWLAA